MPQISLAELNAQLFASMLPHTHGHLAVGGAPVEQPAVVTSEVPAPAVDAPHAKPAAKRAPKAAKADAAPAAPQYTDEQIEILAQAGIDDPATADQQTVAALLGLPSA